MEGRSDLEQDSYPDIKDIEKAVVLIRECMQVNNILPVVGISAFSSITASMFKQHSTYDEYEKAVLRILKQAKQQWNT